MRQQASGQQRGAAPAAGWPPAAPGSAARPCRAAHGRPPQHAAPYAARDASRTGCTLCSWDAPGAQDAGDGCDPVEPGGLPGCTGRLAGVDLSERSRLAACGKDWLGLSRESWSTSCEVGRARVCWEALAAAGWGRPAAHGPSRVPGTAAQPPAAPRRRVPAGGRSQATAGRLGRGAGAAQVGWPRVCAGSTSSRSSCRASTSPKSLSMSIAAASSQRQLFARLAEPAASR